MKPATSNLARNWYLPRPIIKSNQKKSDGGPGLRKLSKKFGFFFNIFATAGASDFKFCLPLGFAKVHHEITPRGKRGPSPGLEELPKIWRFPSIFTQWLKTLNLVHSLSLLKPIIKSDPQEKWVLLWARVTPQIFVISL